MISTTTDCGRRSRLGTTKRLVVVADNSLIVEAIHIGLRQSGGFQILGYANGESAPATAILEAGPDIVLIDDLPTSERVISLIRELRAGDPAVVVLLLTMTMDHDWLERAFAAGANGAICKLIHPSALGTLVRETVNRNVVHTFSRPRRAPMVAPDPPLTPRELEILRLTAGGATNGDVARQLWVTEQTVKFHLSNLYRKLGVSNRTEASHYAHLNGLLGLDRSMSDNPGQYSVRDSQDCVA